MDWTTQAPTNIIVELRKAAEWQAIQLITHIQLVELAAMKADYFQASLDRLIEEKEQLEGELPDFEIRYKAAHTAYQDKALELYRHRYVVKTLDREALTPSLLALDASPASVARVQVELAPLHEALSHISRLLHYKRQRVRQLSEQIHQGQGVIATLRQLKLPDPKDYPAVVRFLKSAVEHSDVEH